MKEATASRPRSLVKKLQDFIGYDPQVSAAASTWSLLPSSTSSISSETKHYLVRLFPFTNWIGNYNLTWFLGDLIAGLTVGIMCVLGSRFVRIEHASC